MSGDRWARLAALGGSPVEVKARAARIYGEVLARSACVRSGNFEAIATDDLKLLFDLYDAASFGGLIGAMLREDGSGAVGFRLSTRMTSAAGKTLMLRSRRRVSRAVKAPASYEIAISTVLLFQTFGDVDHRPVDVAGLVCRDRLEALQRIMEHELLHLAEFLATGRSRCSADPFRSLAGAIFGHKASRHNLVTPREVAAVAHAIRPGDLVNFEHDGVRRVGRVNRITRRATVLVEDPAGRLFSDGRRYATFYVPLGQLRQEGQPFRP